MAPYILMAVLWFTKHFHINFFGGAPQIYWGLHTRTLPASHDNGRVTRYTQGDLRPQPAQSGVQCPPLRPSPSWMPPSWAAEGGPPGGPRPGTGSEQAGPRAAGRRSRHRHSRDRSIAAVPAPSSGWSADLARREHLIHDRVNLVKAEHQVQRTDVGIFP